jgi:hypothetical protein
MIKLFFICVIFMANPFVDLNQKSIPVKLGDETVQVIIHSSSDVNDERVFVHVHENEVASLAAGLDFIKTNGGKLVTIKHSQIGVNRNITFHHKGTTFQFDPNRIYSNNDEVIKRALKADNTNSIAYNEAFAMVKNLAKIVWGQLQNEKYIVSLHNNKNECATCKRKGWFGFKFIEPSYSLNSYVKTCDVDSESSNSAEAIYINPKINNSEFFIVTQQQDFDYLSSKKANVVLQNNDPVDDGSMSVWAFKNGVRYMNAEAKHGKIEEQKKMLSFIKDLK